MAKTADLHTHSKYSSDGEFTPTELVKLAKKVGLTHIALTDHDCVDGVDEAIQAGKELGVEVIPGVEIHSKFGEILGYFIDHKNPALIKLCKQYKVEVDKRANKLLKLLARDGFLLDKDEILKKYNRTQLERPLIAWAMVDKGYATSFIDAFERFLDKKNKKYYVKAKFLSTAKVAKLIRSAGGVAVLAHPYYEDYKSEFRNITKLIRAGLVGMEIRSGEFKPDNYNEIVKEMKTLAEKYNLVLTSSSDFHGSAHPENELGKFNCDASIVEELVKHLQSKTNYYKRP